MTPPRKAGKLWNSAVGAVGGTVPVRSRLGTDLSAVKFPAVRTHGGTPAVHADYASRAIGKGIEFMSTILKWALVMFLVSLVAALFGFTGISAASADVARVLFYVFIVLFIVLLVLGLTAARTVRGP
jgi:uncharacterized membrane protein YtjA (UPF0391 family)